jgi:hypothetical protein
MSELMTNRDHYLVEIRERMKRHGIFFQDIWDRLLQTSDSVLKEIVESDFERRALELKRKLEAGR